MSMNNPTQSPQPTPIPYGPHHTHCTSCDARLIKLKHERTGNHAPIEADPSPNGNCVVDVDKGTYRIASKDERQAHARYVEQGGAAFLRLNHFASCPNAAMYHKERGWR